MNDYDKMVDRMLARDSMPAYKYFYSTEHTVFSKFARIEYINHLDIGTGVGSLIKSFRRDNKKMYSVGVDISESLIKAAKKIHFDDNNSSFSVADMYKLPFKDSLFDLVTSVGAFECVDHLPKVLAEINRVASVNSDFVFSIWNKDKWLNFKYFDRKLVGSVEYSIKELDELLELSGYKLIGYQTIFFAPRRLFWVLYKLLFFNKLKSLYLNIAIQLNKRLEKSRFLNGKGWEIIVHARKVNNK